MPAAYAPAGAEVDKVSFREERVEADHPERIVPLEVENSLENAPHLNVGVRCSLKLSTTKLGWQEHKPGCEGAAEQSLCCPLALNHFREPDGQRTDRDVRALKDIYLGSQS